MWPFKPCPTSEDERLQLLPNHLHRTTPLPRKQIIVLCAMRFTEPVSYTLIFPFINQMLEDLHVAKDPKQIGYYGGLIESLFALAQLCTVFFWGRLSDRVGRKPVLLIGLSGLVISIVSFGLQKSFVGLVISRAFAGVMNGNIAILKSVLAEITDETNEARAFSFLPMCFAIGTIIGPMIGGYLAQPAKQYPDLFGSWTFLINYPYFLPCAVAGAMNFCAILLGFFFLEETLPSQKKVDALSGRPTFRPPTMTRSSSINERRISIQRLLTLDLVILMISWSLLGLNNSAWTAIVPLFAYTRLEFGGLGLSLNQIGTALSINGMFSVVIQTVVFPPVQKRVGTLKLYRGSILIFPFSFIFLAILGWVTKHFHISLATRLTVLVATLSFKSIGGMAIVCGTMLVSNSAPSRNVLGTVNGLSQMGSSLSRAIGPILTTSLFAVSIDKNILHGELVWVVVIAIALLASGVSWLVQDQHPTWRRPLISDEQDASHVTDVTVNAQRSDSRDELEGLLSGQEQEEDAVEIRG